MALSTLPKNEIYKKNREQSGKQINNVVYKL